jgi:hypothetical protein
VRVNCVDATFKTLIKSWLVEVEEEEYKRD